MRRLMPVFVCVALFLSCAYVTPKAEKGAPKDFVCMDCAAISPKAGKCPFCGKEMSSMEKMTVCQECTMPAKGFCPYCRVETVPGLAECVCDKCGKKVSSSECPPSHYFCPKCGGEMKSLVSSEFWTCTKCGKPVGTPALPLLCGCGKCKSCGAAIRTMRTCPMRFKCEKCGLMNATGGNCPMCKKMMQKMEMKKMPDDQLPAQEK